MSVQATRASIEPLAVRLISSLDEFIAIGVEWDNLVERSGVDPVFLSHAWLRTWWECFGEGNQLCIFTIREGSVLMGAAPLMIADTRMYGLKVRCLQSIYNYHTPRFDFLIADRHDEVYKALWSEIANPAQKWDFVLLAQLPVSSPTIKTMSEYAAHAGWTYGCWNARPSPYIPLGCDYETFFNRLKGKERYNLRKRQSRLTEMAPLALEVIRERKDVRSAMEDGLRIEAAAWKGDNGTSMNSDPKVQEFYLRFAERAAELGWLRLCFLRLGEKRIAFDFAIQKDQALYGVKIGYDPEFHTCSPGHILLLLLLQQACIDQCKEYDFLGVDDEWKYSFTKDIRNHQWLFLYPNRLRPKLLHAAKFRWIPWVKNTCTYLRGRA
jgi:CelD/BcsL family acetyltransferase involved in cellulose biosynthesis